MTSFRILYLAPGRGEAFRVQGPQTPPFVLRRSHYEDGPEVAAETPYELWRTSREKFEDGADGAPKPLEVGDALETSERLLVCNFWGFDPAEWHEARGEDDSSEPNGHSSDAAPQAAASRPHIRSGA